MTEERTKRRYVKKSPVQKDVLTFGNVTAYSAKKTAEILGCTRLTLNNYVKQRRIDCRRIGMHTFFTTESIEKFLRGE